MLLPAAVLLVETLAAFLPGASAQKEQETGLTPRVVVLVPAHNEVAQIAETVRALVRDLPAEGSVFVVADNCTDETALRARSAGATVVERHDLSLVGKGFAISRGLEHLAASPPDVVIIVDADCQISPGGVALLARRAAQSGRPIQAEYLLGAPESQSPMAVVSALAVLLRNRIRPRGLDRLGLPCHLTGSGMAFPWNVLRAAPETGANLVEDLVMGIDLALLGASRGALPGGHRCEAACPTAAPPPSSSGGAGNTGNFTRSSPTRPGCWARGSRAARRPSSRWAST